MGLKKGQTNNPNGRPKGTPNKVTGNMRKWLTDLINENKAQIEKDLKELEPKDRLQILERFMQYAIPKMQSVQAQIDYNNLTDEQLDDVIQRITNQIETE